ncbi:hypothetical protein KVT40_009200 [Elsinoe batatas]|uniref:Vezatin n=1 Tax=Elsinoe batatas TaxID=2601811 RepID=A0A8K0PG48_9PEZI|nr:hypothetical protein KVT40_009200 [Elsinoe batatas]
MESVVAEDTPLASLLEGEGRSEGEHAPSDRSSSPPHDFTFAPRAAPTLRSRLRASSLTLHLSLPHPNVSRATTACSKALNMHISEGDAHFQEHFRYIIIASQLLEENPDHGALQAAQQNKQETGGSQQPGKDPMALSWVGACMTAAIAFLAVRLYSWAESGKLKTSKIIAIVLTLPLLAVGLYFHTRQQSRKYRRQKAVEAASLLTSALQSFELISTSGLTLVQEVELVAKGYRISTPLPPVSRLDDAKVMRRCMPLRRQLNRTFREVLQALVNTHTQLQTRVNYDDYIKYLDVYDISREAIQDSIATQPLAGADAESLGTLRALAYRVSVMRRALLCDLLSLEFRGDAQDQIRWKAATEMAQNLSQTILSHTRDLRKTLGELQEFAVPPSPKQPKQSSDRIKTQVRKISNLSTGIRSLQAKMTLLREESNTAVSSADDLTDLGPTLLSQYESIGADLHALLADWETGKNALSTNITKHERRISFASSGLRSPASGSFNGLASVDEGGPADALRALNGDREGSLSPRSSMPSTPGDEEVFEAIALPKQRSLLTREERIRNMQEERLRAEERKEARESGMNMMKELRSVIGVRARARGRDGPEARVMSM